MVSFLFVYSLVTLFNALVKAGLGLPDTEAWNMIETIADKQKLGFKLLVN